MSADFKTLLLKDSRLAGITDELDYAVMSGASSNTYQQFNAISSSSSSMVFNIQVPSENIVVSREVLISSDIYFKMVITNVPVNDFAFKYGETDALQAFPLNSLFTTMSAQVNNTNVSVNLQDVLPQLIRLNNNRELYRYNGMTPSLPDQAYRSYADGVDAANSPLNSYASAGYDGDLEPRGAFPIVFDSISRNSGGTVTANELQSTATTDVFTIEAHVSVTEPLIGLSPFIFGDCEYNKQGLVGINAMNFVMNVDSAMKRFLSTSNDYDYTLSLGNSASAQPFANAKLLLNFLSTQPTDLVPARNVVPYMDFPRYLSLQSSVGNVAAGASATLNSQNIQINQLPDYFIVCVRKPMSQQSLKDSSSFMKINSVSVNLNNTYGLLSSATAQDLWRISVNNHSQQSWSEFSGEANVRAAAGTPSGSLTNTINTTGSLLILSPAKDLSLPAYLSSGSIGQYNFQLQIGVENTLGAAITPEICVICVNSGLFTTIAGSSNIYTGILTKQMVLDAQSGEDAIEPVAEVQYRRLVGGKLGNMGATAVKKMRPALGKMCKVKEAFGMGVASAGGIHSGGGVQSAGAMSALDKLCA